jgi:hypothetical protein
MADPRCQRHESHSALRFDGLILPGLLKDSALHDSFPDLWSLEEVVHCEHGPCDQSTLNNDDPALAVVVEMLSPTGLTHFCPVTDWRNWKIADTWDGVERTIGQRGRCSDGVPTPPRSWVK